MQTYRVYIMRPSGHMQTSPHVVACKDNDAAIRVARQYLNGSPVEVWEGATRIARLEPGEGD